jgi:hypothetical protein
MGVDGDPGAHTINVKNIDASSLGGDGVVEPGVPTINVKTSMMDPLVSADRDPGAPTINVKNVDDGLPGRCRSYKTGSTHHQRKKCHRWASWLVLAEIQEHPPST